MAISEERRITTNGTYEPDSIGHMLALSLSRRNLVQQLKENLGEAKVRELTTPLDSGEPGSFYDGPRRRTPTNGVIKESQRPPVQQPPFTADLSPHRKEDRMGFVV